MAFIKAKKTAWNTERGMALLYEDDPKHGVIIPIDALPPLGAHARRVIAGVQASKGQTTKTYDWRYAHPLKEDAFAVETMRADAATLGSSSIRRQNSGRRAFLQGRDQFLGRFGRDRTSRQWLRQTVDCPLAGTLVRSACSR